MGELTVQSKPALEVYALLAEVEPWLNVLAVTACIVTLPGVTPPLLSTFIKISPEIICRQFVERAKLFAPAPDCPLDPLEGCPPTPAKKPAAAEMSTPECELQ